MVDEQMVVPTIEEVAEPVAEVEEEQDDEFEDDDSKGFDEEEAWEVNKEWLMAPVTPPSVPAGKPPSVYEDLSTRLGNVEYERGELVQRFNQTDGSRLQLRLSKVSKLQPRESRRLLSLLSRIRETDCSIGEETTRTLVVLVALHFDF
nr:hypothetical protein [Tanacetum cinerariifolium]